MLYHCAYKSTWRVKGVIVLILKMLFWKTKKLKGEPKVHYSLIKYKKKGSYDILTDISEHVTLIKLMDSWGNVNHAISVVGYWIFDSNYEKSLVLNREYLDMICALSVCEEQVDAFETVFTAARYNLSTVHLNKK